MHAQVSPQSMTSSTKPALAIQPQYQKHNNSMPTTRNQTQGAEDDQRRLTDVGITLGTKRDADEVEDTKIEVSDAAKQNDEISEPPAKKAKTKPDEEPTGKTKPAYDIDYSLRVGARRLNRTQLRTLIDSQYCRIRSD
jgi:hypothetical protein